MKPTLNYDRLFDSVTGFYSTLLRFILHGLLILLCIAFVVGIIKAGIDLYQSFSHPLEELLQKILLNTVFIVALLEISIVVLGYLKNGAVQVRYIVDTILIIMLNEIVVLWFRKPELPTMIGISIIILTLTAVRIGVTRLSPNTGTADKA